MQVAILSSHRDLEQTLHSVISTLAAERGVTVKETRLALRAESAHALEFQVTCAVRAMVVSTELVVRGRAEIGADLCARFTSLELVGEGMIAGLAKAAIEPRLAELRAKPYAVANVRLPGLAVHDITVSVGDSVSLAVTLVPAS